MAPFLLKIASVSLACASAEEMYVMSGEPVEIIMPGGLMEMLDSIMGGPAQPQMEMALATGPGSVEISFGDGDELTQMLSHMMPRDVLQSFMGQPREMLPPSHPCERELELCQDSPVGVKGCLMQHYEQLSHTCRCFVEQNIAKETQSKLTAVDPKHRLVRDVASRSRMPGMSFAAAASSDHAGHANCLPFMVALTVLFSFLCTCMMVSCVRRSVRPSTTSEFEAVVEAPAPPLIATHDFVDKEGKPQAQSAYLMV